jgi:hypothetical protein
MTPVAAAVVDLGSLDTTRYYPTLFALATSDHVDLDQCGSPH